MSDKRQTSYDVLKTTLALLPMELREGLVRKCPELRNIDKIIPYLEFGYVSLSEERFTIDDRQFEFRIVSHYEYRRYERGETRTFYNITLSDVPKMITADDIVIRDLRREEEEARLDQDARGWRAEFRALRDGGGWEELLSDGISRHLEMKLKTSDGDFIKRFNDPMQFPILMKKLLASYFDKNGVIPIKHLVIKDSEGVFRLPPNLKMHVRELSLPRNTTAVLSGFEKVFAEECLPLQCINVDISTDWSILAHPLVRSATRLNIYNFNGPLSRNEELANAFAGLTNNIVEITTFGVSSVTNLVTIAERWIQDGRRLGCTLFVQILKYDIVLDVQDALVENHGAVRGRLTNPDFSGTFFRNCVTIPMGQDKELNVHGCYVEPRDFFRMEVMKKGSAVAIQQDA